MEQFFVRLSRCRKIALQITPKLHEQFDAVFLGLVSEVSATAVLTPAFSPQVAPDIQPKVRGSILCFRNAPKNLHVACGPLDCWQPCPFLKLSLIFSKILATTNTCVTELAKWCRWKATSFSHSAVSDLVKDQGDFKHHSIPLCGYLAYPCEVCEQTRMV